MSRRKAFLGGRWGVAKALPCTNTKSERSGVQTEWQMKVASRSPTEGSPTRGTGQGQGEGLLGVGEQEKGNWSF